MKPRSIIDLENTITKKENNYFKEKIIKQEEDYNKNSYFFGYGGHIIHLKGQIWITFYNYLYNNFYHNKNKLLNYFNNDK